MVAPMVPRDRREEQMMLVNWLDIRELGRALTGISYLSFPNSLQVYDSDRNSLSFVWRFNHYQTLQIEIWIGSHIHVFRGFQKIGFPEFKTFFERFTCEYGQNRDYRFFGSAKTWVKHSSAVREKWLQRTG